MSSNNSATASAPLIPLSQRNLWLVLAGCFCLIVFLSGSSSAISLVLTPKLEQLNALDQFPIAIIIGTIGIAIMTPIGGSLGNIFGRKVMLIVPSIIAIISIVAVAYSTSFTMFAIARLMLSLAVGAYTSSPYIVVSMIGTRKEVPKYMGLLASAMALGIFIGPSIGGLLLEYGYLNLATYFMALILVVGVILIQIGLPKIPGNSSIKLDWIGIVLLAIIISVFVLVLNYLPELGWNHQYILIGIVLFFVLLPVFVLYENNQEKKGNSPVIAVRLFKNIEFTVLLLVSLSTYYLVTPMVAYGSRAGYELLQASSVVIGMFTLPRTIITLILPTFAGIWLSKKYTNSWIAMAIATGLPAIALLPLSFVTPEMPVIVFFVSFGLTGISESFRAVSVTPAAQDTLEAKDLGVGTSLINFFNSMGSVLGASLSGYLFNLAGGDVQSGIRNAFTSMVVVSILGFLLVIFYVRPKIIQHSKSEQAS